MKADERAFVEALRADDVSGATAIVARAAAFLAAGERERGVLLTLADACVEAQPAMAGLLTMRRIVREADSPAAALMRLVEQLRRAPAAIARQAAEVLRLGLTPGLAGRPALTVVTCSASAAVEETLRVLGATADVTVCCAESQPRGEGAMLARRLAVAGIAVQLFSDAGASAAVPGSDALIIGADAIGPDAVVNKVGSAALCALSSVTGVPVYALAGREKLLEATEFGELRFLEPPSDLRAEESGPSGLRLRNPIFETIPRHLISVVITDAGSI